jgi:hypothetical protein
MTPVETLTWVRVEERDQFCGLLRPGAVPSQHGQHSPGTVSAGEAVERAPVTFFGAWFPLLEDSGDSPYARLTRQPRACRPEPVLPSEEWREDTRTSRVGTDALPEGNQSVAGHPADHRRPAVLGGVRSVAVGDGLVSLPRGLHDQ